MSLCSSFLRATLLVAAFALFAPASGLAQSVTSSPDQAAFDERNLLVNPVSAPESVMVTVPTSSAGGHPNDILNQAGSIWAGGFGVTGSTVGATAESTSNPSASCTFGTPDNDGDNSVWWWFTATSNGTVTIDLDGSGFDTILTILDGSLNEVGCNDDDPNNPAGDFTSRIENAPVSANSPYFVRITGYQGDEGSLNLNFTGPVTGPPDDEIALRFREEATVYLGTNKDATGPTNNEPSASCTTDGNNSVWRFFDAPANSSLTVDLTGSDFDTVLLIVDAARSNELACDDDGGDGTTSRIENFPLVAGQRYYVRVTGFQGAEGDIRYSVTFNPTTANEPDAELPTTLSLDKAYPNPFQDGTTVAYSIAEAGTVRVEVYDLLGRRVSTLVDGVQAAGAHTALFDGADLPSGVYTVRVQHQGAVQTQRITLTR